MLALAIYVKVPTM